MCSLGLRISQRLFKKKKKKIYFLPLLKHFIQALSPLNSDRAISPLCSWPVGLLPPHTKVRQKGNCS